MAKVGGPGLLDGRISAVSGKRPWRRDSAGGNKMGKEMTQQTGSSKKWPRVAIIILNYNGWKDTIECLESVFRITYPNYQVIVIDNGSTDGSMEKIKAWAEGKQEVLTPKPTHPLYHLSHPPIKKKLFYILNIIEKKQKKAVIQN